ncbi:MAG TPA: hypothetical protein VK867_09810, partial [Candidatus Limnocylindrales bacterium]|nr:hypothetical protein [Candidatus Limnocylindrales bacterium]
MSAPTEAARLRLVRLIASVVVLVIVAVIPGRATALDIAGDVALSDDVASAEVTTGAVEDTAGAVEDTAEDTAGAVEDTAGAVEDTAGAVEDTAGAVEDTAEDTAGAV